jgi:hypothetical protein
VSFITNGTSVWCGTVVRVSSSSFCFDFSDLNVAHFRGTADPYNRKTLPPMVYIIEKSINIFRQSSRTGCFIIRPAIILVIIAPISAIVHPRPKITDE